MTATATAAAPQPAIKVLLVEDSLPNRDMLTRRLERRGFVVCSAADGPSGVAMSASEMPDVILMDVALGAMDGWEATRLIKSQSENGEHPDHRADGSRSRDRSRQERRSRLRGLRYQAGRSRAVAREDQVHACPEKVAAVAAGEPVDAERKSPDRLNSQGVELMSGQSGVDPVEALTGSMRDFRELPGKRSDRSRRCLLRMADSCAGSTVCGPIRKPPSGRRSQYVRRETTAG